MNDTSPDSPENDHEIESFLASEDVKYGKNEIPTQNIKPEQKTQSFELGLARSIHSTESTISGSNDNFWKTIPLVNLPSQGLFYPEGSELTIRSATVTEIRQWSTIDEDDILDIDDQLNFIIEKCVRFKINGGKVWLTWRDLLEIDRLYTVFLIHEITFPDGQNELSTLFECTDTCSEDGKFKDMIKVRSQMLQLFEMPEELMQWYSNEYKCFEIISSKLNETFYLYMPTIGVIERLRKRIAEVKANNQLVDKAFIRMAPYLIQDWSKLGIEQYSVILNNSFNWHINKLTFITRFYKLMKEARRSSLSTICPKCGAKLVSALFSREGFTIKDLFLISGRLNELV